LTAVTNWQLLRVDNVSGLMTKHPMDTQTFEVQPDSL